MMWVCTDEDSTIPPLSRVCVSVSTKTLFSSSANVFSTIKEWHVDKTVSSLRVTLNKGRSLFI